MSQNPSYLSVERQFELAKLSLAIDTTTDIDELKQITKGLVELMQRERQLFRTMLKDKLIH